MPVTAAYVPTNDHTPQLPPSTASSPVARAWLVLVVATSAGVLALTGSMQAAVAPAALTFLAYAAWKLPMRVLLFTVFFLALATFAPKPEEGTAPLWDAIRPLYDFLYVYVSRFTGLGFMAIKGVELVYVLIMVLMLMRASRGIRIDTDGLTPVANVLVLASGAGFAAVLAWEIWGTVRGGDIRGSFFQLRQLLELPMLTVLFSYALRGMDDFRTIAKLVTVAAAIKIALGIFYLVHDAWPQGIEPPVMTGHHDSVLFDAVLFMWCAWWVHRPSARALVPLGIVALWMITGLVLNNRRIAYVSLVASFAVMYALLHGPVKRRMTKIGLRALPFLLVYLFLSRTHSTGMFAPGASIMSVSDVQKDPSSLWRDMENLNLLATLGYNKVTGAGWGHEYVEIFRAADISRYMPQYRLVPHNSILWLLGVGGIIGFTLIWMQIAVGVFLAARSYYFARAPLERTAALSSIGVLVMFANQSWGDMGTQGDTSILLVACALAISGKLARSTGAWPEHTRIFPGTARPGTIAPPFGATMRRPG